MIKFTAVISLIALMLIGCASHSVVRNEFNLKSPPKTIVTDSSYSKMIIFNSSSSFLYGPDGSGVIGIKIDSKAFTRLTIDEYLQFYVPKGKYTFELEHIDVLSFKSSHIIDAFEDSTLVEINATTTSNEAQIVPSLPSEFLKDYTPHFLTEKPVLLEIQAQK
jgi:uncharacterized protein YcfL